MTKIKDKDLEDFLLYSFKKSSIKELEESEISKLESIVIENLKYLIMFPNLRNIIIKNISIKEEEIKNISSLKYLKKLDFISCKIDANLTLCNPELKQITFNACKKINLNIVPHNIELLAISESEKVDLQPIENFSKLKNLILQDLEIPSLEFISRLPNLQYINLNRSKANIEEIQNKNIKVEYEEYNII